jgi:hypothetical protein
MRRICTANNLLQSVRIRLIRGLSLNLDCHGALLDGHSFFRYTIAQCSLGWQEKDEIVIAVWRHDCEYSYAGGDDRPIFMLPCAESG